MRISDWSSDVCSSDLSFGKLRVLLLSEFGAFRSLCLLPGGKRISEAIKIDVDPEEIINALKITPKRAGGSGRNIKYAYAEAICDLRTDPRLDRKSVVQGKSVSVRGNHGGRRMIKKKK